MLHKSRYESLGSADGSKERGMAERDEMLEEHQRTWHGFVKLIAATSSVIILILILMGIFLL